MQACPPWTGSVTWEYRISGLSACPASVPASLERAEGGTTHSHLVHVIWLGLGSKHVTGA